MVYLVKTTLSESCGDYDIETSLVMKSALRKKLQAEIKRLFDKAVEEMDGDSMVNGCSKEDFEYDNGYFDKDKLSIFTLFPTPSMDRETVNYAIVNDKYTKEV